MKTPAHEGADKWTPLNLVSRWYWTDGDKDTEIDLEQLRGAWFDGGSYRPQVLALFDADGNGELDQTELPLDRDEKVELIRSLLAAQGVAEPVIKAEVRAYHIHHSVALDDANRDCARCHEASTEGEFGLADHLPGGVLPSLFRGIPESIREQWRQTADGRLELVRPAPLSTVKVTVQEKP